MVKHIVFWRLCKGVSAKQTQEIKLRLEALKGQIREINRIEVGFDLVGKEASADVALYSEFDSMDALQAYQDHPAHQDVVAFIKPLVAERRVVDYEC